MSATGMRSVLSSVISGHKTLFTIHQGAMEIPVLKNKYQAFLCIPLMFTFHSTTLIDMLDKFPLDNASVFVAFS